MESERKSAGFKGAPKAALAGLLALLLVLTTALSANPSLHRSLHNLGAAGNDLCLACLLAKGSVDVTAPAVVLMAAAAALVIFIRRFEFVLLPVSDRRLDPSRAPPALLPPSRVAG